MTNTLTHHIDISFNELSSRDNRANKLQLLPALYLNDTYTCFALLDADFNFITVNPAYAKAYGEFDDLFSNHQLSELYPPDALQIFKNVLITKKPSRILAHRVVPPGQPDRYVTFCNLTITPLTDEENTVVALLLAETDVTHSVRTEQALYKSKRILSAIKYAQDQHNTYAETEDILEALLTEVIDLTESEYGFIGQFNQDANGQLHMEIQTILDFSRNSETRNFHPVETPQLLHVTDPHSLIGEVACTGKTMHCNDPANDRHCSGFPEDHPSLQACLGMPLIAGKIMTGAIYVANCADGYDEALVDLLQPVVNCYMQLIVSNAADRERREALLSLEERNYLIRDMAIPAVEAEHSELIALINDCYEKMDNDADTDIIVQLLEKCYSACVEHFQHEGELMRTTAYPEYEPHSKHHEWLLPELRKKIDRYVETEDDHILRSTLSNWFGRHFSTFDLRLHNYFSN